MLQITLKKKVSSKISQEYRLGKALIFRIYIIKIFSKKTFN